MTKKCTKCKTEKEYTEFYKHKNYKDGYNVYCKSCFKKYHVEYKAKNRNKIRERKKKWVNNNRDKVKKHDQKYIESNRGKVNAYNSKRRAERLSAIPNSIAKSDNKTITEIYRDIKDCQWLSESKLEVDHIVPLKHKNVCGLHVSWNLQVLTREDNNRKKNKFDGTYENESWKKIK